MKRHPWWLRYPWWLPVIAGAIALWLLSSGCASNRPEPPMCGQSDLPVSEWDADANWGRRIPCETDAECEALDSLLTSLGWTWTPEDSI